MPTVLVREVLRRASVLLTDAAPQFHRHGQNEMVDWLNDAQVAVAKFLPAACSRIDAVRLQPGTRQYIGSIPAADCKPGDGSVPAVPVIGTALLDIIRNMGANGATPGRPVRVVDRKTLDASSNGWHTEAAEVIKAFVYDPATPRHFYVSPGVPAGSNVWVELSYTAQPLRIPAGTGGAGAESYRADGDSIVTITIADEFIDDLVNYIVARANMKPVEWADAAKAVAFTSLFTGSLNAKVEALTGHNPNLKFLPFAMAPIGAAK